MAYDSEESSNHGDSGQEDYHNFRREEDAAEEENRDLIARTEYGHLVQFLGRTESGTRELRAFRAYLGRELENGNYSFPVLNDEVHANFYVLNRNNPNSLSPKILNHYTPNPDQTLKPLILCRTRINPQPLL